MKIVMLFSMSTEPASCLLNTTVTNVMTPKARTVPPQKLDDRFAAGWPIPVRLGRLQPGRYVVNLRATSSHGQLSEAYHIVIVAEGRNAGRGN